MAIGGTQLYNKAKQTINPISEANAIDCQATGKPSTVHQDIADLYKQIAELTKDSEAVNNILIDISYKRSKSKDKADIVEDTGWSTVFISPTSDYPYIWKRTIITYKGAEVGQGSTVYEIVASADAEVTQTIYRAVSDSTQPVISYIDETTGKEDPTKYDNTLPQYWSEIPASVSAATPNVFMSTRKKVNGKWEMFSVPAQYGRWAFDSNVVFKYQVTGTNTVPDLEINSENPGDKWVNENTGMFTGFLWMISATAINGQLQSYNDAIWNGPNLISIVK